MRLLFFAHLKDLTGQTECSWQVDHALTTLELWGRLEAAYPGMERYRKSTRLARNGEYSSANTHFANEDEVALIPPVSGG